MNNNILKIFLAVCLIFFFQLINAQNFTESDTYQSFFKVDIAKLNNASETIRNADTLQLKVNDLFRKANEAYLMSESEDDRQRKSDLLKESEKLKKTAYQQQEAIYVQYAQANHIKYKIYMKHFNLPWDYLTPEEKNKRNNIKFETQGNFDRAVKFRQTSENLIDGEKIKNLATADSIEKSSLVTMELFVEEYATKEKKDVGAPKFRDTETFREMFKHDMLKFKSIDKTIVEGDSLIRKGAAMVVKSKDMVALAQNIRWRFKRNKEIAAAESTKEKGLAYQLKGYDNYHKARVQLNELYSQRLASVRAKADPKRLKQGAEEETKIAGKWPETEQSRKLAELLTTEAKLEEYKKIDAIQVEHINTLEEILGIYKNYNREEENVFINEGRRKLTDTYSKMSGLIGRCYTERDWTMPIENKNNEINDERDKIETTFDVRFQRIFMDRILRIEYEQAEIINKTILTLEKENELEFKDYRNKISSLGEINKSLDKYQKAKELDNSIVEKYNLAKQKLQDAYMAEQKLKPVLETANGEAPISSFTKLQNLQFQILKYEVIILMLEAVELKYNLKDDIERVTNLYSRISLGDNRPEINKKEEKKKNTTANKKTTKKNPKDGNNSHPDIHFKIQLESFKNNKVVTEFRGYDADKVIVEHLHNGVAYMDGKYQFDETKTALNKAIKNGYRDAYIVAYDKGIRVDMTDALAKLKVQTPIKHNPTPSEVIEAVNVNPALANKTVTAPNIANVKGLVYTIQIGAFRKAINWNEIGNLTPVYKDASNKNKIKYFVGLYRTVAAANIGRATVIKAGIKSAYVIAYEGGKKVSLKGSEIATTEHTKTAEGIVYKVQVAAGASTLSPVEKKEFDNLKQYGIQGKYKSSNGLTIYTIGSFSSYSDAMQCRQNILNKGVNDAFVISFQNEKEIPINQALKQTEK